MKDKKLFNFNMPLDIYDYLNIESKKNYTTMTQYIINLILEDMKKYSVYEEMSPPEWFNEVVIENKSDSWDEAIEKTR